MNEGDIVRVVRVPDAVRDSTQFQTRSVLERCIGHTFPVMGFNSEGMIQIDVGELVGKAAWLETIWIEPDCVEVLAH